MARTVITRTALPVTGLNLTDATYTTLGVGAANGIECPYRAGDLLILNNASGSSATYTIKVAQPNVFSVLGVTVPDIAVVLATGKTLAIALTDVMNQATGVVQVDCSVAGKALMLAMGA